MADRWAADNQRPVALFPLLTAAAIPFGATSWTSSLALAMPHLLVRIHRRGIPDGFLKVDSYAFPREQSAMMSAIASASWALLNAMLSPIIGRLFQQQRYAEAFWLIALVPAAGISGWLALEPPPGGERSG